MNKCPNCSQLEDIATESVYKDGVFSHYHRKCFNCNHIWDETLVNKKEAETK